MKKAPKKEGRFQAKVLGSVLLFWYNFCVKKTSTGKNDFGLGFYCTESNDLAKEWAVSSLSDGFSNQYTLDTEYLSTMKLNSPDYTILNWMAILVEHRLFSIRTPVARRAKQYLIEHFGINVNAYDLITGYRADDSYFDYAEAFLNKRRYFK